MKCEDCPKGPLWLEHSEIFDVAEKPDFRFEKQVLRNLRRFELSSTQGSSTPADCLCHNDQNPALQSHLIPPLTEMPR